MRVDTRPARPPLSSTNGHSRTWLQRLSDTWFSPKSFESEALYEHLGVRFIKRYVPTGGDFFIRRYGIRIAHIQASLGSLVRFERFTRRLEAIHEVVFLGFVVFSLRRAFLRKITLWNLAFEIAVYVILILSPALLQRYNRLRVYSAIRRMAT